MSFNRPTLTEIIQRVRTDVISRLAADDVLRRADAEVYAAVVGAVSHGLHGYIEWLSRQLFYDTADAEYLARWASMFIGEKIPASSATGTATFIAEVGSVIAADTLLQALDGVRYKVDAEVIVSASPVTISVTALEPGENGNRSVGQALSLVSPISGVQPAATVVVMSGGSDIEQDEAYRARLAYRIKNPPQGGSKSDYVRWALEVPGVTRAWAYPLELGAGKITIRFVRDNDGSGASVIPDSAEVAAVQAYIDEKAFATATPVVVAPVAVPLNFTIQGLVPDTAAVRASVAQELQDMIERESEPGGSILLSHIRAAISAATDESDYVLASPTANVVNTTGNITTMGTITWA
jgi:uncharacterized phage protein gp47/JayE